MSLLHTAVQTLRLPVAFKREAEAYAESLGVSLNALIAVALRDYLDARTPARLTSAGARDAGGVAAATPAPSIVPAPLETVGISQKTTANKASADPHRVAALRAMEFNTRALCPCGSGKRAKQCHGGVA
ncbi:MAG: SEC-C metal-binding domain-containing protein [Lysobacter sp.]